MRFGRQTKINDYNLVELLGEGLTSCVYKAIKRHRRWGVEQTVALKILKSKDLVPTFAQEVQALGRVDSLHCVKFYDWIDGQKTPVLVLEYLDGVTLDECLHRVCFSQALIDEIIAQVQVGLKDLQKNQLKHGDLSPKNIFITTQGVVKLLDFGLSLQKNTQSGTLAYLSPEGWRKEEQTAQSDLFSLGLIKEEMETGARVYTREEAEQRAEQLKNKNTLLCTDARERFFLPVISTAGEREALAKQVLQLKNAHKEVAQTTVMANQAPGEARKFFPRWSAAVLTFFVLMYSHMLHPSTVVGLGPTLLRLEVRSFRWAEIRLYQTQKNRRVLLKKQYTPFLHKGLPMGTYQIEWSMPPQHGAISVHLNKNRRILLP